MTTLYIKNMVCDRCIRVVKEEIERLGHIVETVVLGEVHISGSLTNAERSSISEVLGKNGFELLESKAAKLIEQIKLAVIESVRSASPIKSNYSQYLSKKLGREYTYLSSLFSSTENITIEQYIIEQKIERVKELIIYDEYSLSQIAKMVGYSSVSHLSNQFKKVTGLTPSFFKSIKGEKRKTIDAVVKP
jgi:AraC-like DNA-binding protein